MSQEILRWIVKKRIGFSVVLNTKVPLFHIGEVIHFSTGYSTRPRAPIQGYSRNDAEVNKNRVKVVQYFFACSLSFGIPQIKSFLSFDTFRES